MVSVRALLGAGIVAGALLSAGFGVSSGPAGAQGPIPVWISPALELDGLGAIDARLERNFDPDDRVEASRGGPNAVVRIEGNNCKAIRRLAGEGALPDSPNDRFIFVYQKSTCDVVEMLRSAEPARDSFLRDFTLNAAAFDYLPAMVDVADDCAAICQLYNASLRRQSWRAYNNGSLAEPGQAPALTVPAFTIEITPERETVVTRGGSRVSFEMLARGDFNRDGLEDLVVRVSRGADDVRLGAARLFVLSRDQPDGVLRVIDAAAHLCPAAECGQP